MTGGDQNSSRSGVVCIQAGLIELTCSSSPDDYVGDDCTPNSNNAPSGSYFDSTSDYFDMSGSASDWPYGP